MIKPNKFQEKKIIEVNANSHFVLNFQTRQYSLKIIRILRFLIAYGDSNGDVNKSIAHSIPKHIETEILNRGYEL